MSKTEKPAEKTRLHELNRNREPYNLDALVEAMPTLAEFVQPNKHGAMSVDFAQPAAVKLLNKALLKHYYGIENWDFPDSNLCPPVPGRADYLHYMADLLAQSNFGVLPPSSAITVLDVGTGASCIYPIIGIAEYGWNFVASETDVKSLESAQKTVQANPQLADRVECRLQPDSRQVFRNIINEADHIDFTMCNPPFHASADDAAKGTQRKVKNLSGKIIEKSESPTLNFSGQANELVYPGGELGFIKNMIADSAHFAKNCYWFSTLVSKQSNLKSLYKILNEYNVSAVKTIAMGTGNKVSRIIAWSFLDKKEQQQWRESRWKKA